MRFSLLVASSLAAVATAGTVTLNWDLTWKQFTLASDPVFGTSQPSKYMIAINGSFPPPPVYVHVGDVIYLTVTNNLGPGNETTLHAHGFHQMNNNLYDGPQGITQCAIKDGESFQYIWTAEQQGTFWYHSHHVGQYPAGLRAPFIVQNVTQPSDYVYGADVDSDLVISMSDWYSLNQTLVDNVYNFNGAMGRSSTSYKCGQGLEVPPDGIVINDQINPTILLNRASIDGRMRLRFINMSAFSTMTIWISGGVRMRIMEVDSIPVHRDFMPFAQAIELNAGQRTSVILDLADLGSNKNFNIYSTIDPEHYNGNACYSGNGYALTSIASVKFIDMPFLHAYDQFATVAGPTPPYDNSRMYVSGYKLANLPSFANKFATAPPSTTVFSDEWYFSNIMPAAAVPRIMFQNGTMPQTQTRLVFLELTASDANTHFANLNGGAYTGPSDAVLLQAMRPTPPFPACPASRQPIWGNTDDVTLYGSDNNNTATLSQGEQVIVVITSHIGSHTFHLHGHDFQILYHGSESRPKVPLAPFDAWRLRSNGYNMPANPMRRDTLFITQQTYSIVAFTANNPGAWFFHCHNDFHAESGMAGVFVTGPDLRYLGAQPGPGNWGDIAFQQCRSSIVNPPSSLAAWPKSCLPA